MSLRDSLPERHALRTRPYRIRSILDVRTIDVLVVVCEDRSSDAELGVRTVSCGFGGGATSVEGVELGAGYIVGLAGFGDMGFVAGEEEFGGGR